MFDDIDSFFVNAASRKIELMPSIVKHFTIDFDINDVNNDAPNMASLPLQSSSDK